MNILKLLSGEKYVSGNEIGKALGISRAAVHKRIQTLKSLGCVIESSPKGYRAVEKADVFSADEVYHAAGKNLSVCKKIYHFRKTDSTQIKLKKLALKNAAEGTIVVADEQEGAYGRMQRSWSSRTGGLWFSLLLKPEISPENAPKIALIISIAVKRALEKEHKVKTSIKWPNDILYKDKKLSGIIIEMSAEQDAVNWIAAGIGINLNNCLPEDLKSAVSLSVILNKNINRARLLGSFLKEFDPIYERFLKKGFSVFAEEYNRNAAYKGKNVIIDNGFDIIKGVNKGIDESGSLLIKTAAGVEKILTGTLRKS